MAQQKQTPPGGQQKTVSKGENRANTPIEQETQNDKKQEALQGQPRRVGGQAEGER
jgi:hypothetical protein